MQPAFREHPLFAVVLAGYVVLALLYGVVNPIHEATDEIRHYRFVRHIVNEHALPVQELVEQPRIQAHHPPLYYLTAALASFWVPTPDLYAAPPVNPYWQYRYYDVSTDNKNLYIHDPDEAFPWHGHALAAHLARWVTTLWGAAAVWATYALGLEVFRDKWLAAGGVAFIAFNPQFLYLSGAVNNDVPAAAAGAGVLLLSVRVAVRGVGTRRALWLGLAFGAALLTKTHLLALGGVVVLAYLWAGVRERALRRAVKALAVVMLAAALLSGWWFARNVTLYGEPTGFVRVTELWGVRDPLDSLRWAFMEIPYAWTSLWGRFGYGQIPLPDFFYGALALMFGAGVLGLVLPAANRQKSAARPLNAGAVALLVAQAAGMAVVVYAYILVSPAGAMGRFYFPGLPALGLLIFAGLARLLRGRERAVVAVHALMAALATAALVDYLAPAYALPPAPDMANRPAHTVDVAFGDVVRLRGYEISAETVRPGEPVFVSLHWEPLRTTDKPLSVFVHCLGLYDLPVAIRTTYTGLGTYPSTLWEPGRAFVETYRVDIPRTAMIPDWLTVQVGLFDAETGARLPVEVAGGAVEANRNGDAAALGQITMPAAPDARLPKAVRPLDINFGDRIALIGYEIYPRVVPQGRNMYVTLYWQALRPLADESIEDLRVFFQTIGEDGEVYARMDGYPQGGQSLPSTWTPGEVIKDERRLVFGEDAPAGFYTLWVGWMDQANDYRRLPILQPDGRWAGDALMLPRIRLAPTPEEAQLWMTDPFGEGR